MYIEWLVYIGNINLYHGGSMILNYSKNIQTKHFKFVFSDEDKEFIHLFSDFIENEYVNLCDQFHIEKSGQSFEFYICNSINDYIIATNKKKEEYQDWMVGWADVSCGRLCLLSPNVATNFSMEELRSIMVHEIVHIAFDSICESEDIECWIAEGIAVYYANQTNMEYISETEYPYVKEISGKGDCDNFYDHGGYDYCGIYVWYLIRKYGFDNFLKAYTNKIDLTTLITDGFEKEAIMEYKAHMSK